MSRYGWLQAYEEWVAEAGDQLRDATLEEVAHFFEYTAADASEAYLGG